MIRIGTSGWSYPHWRGGAFYPPGLAAKRELEHASRVFDSLEVNRSFYSLLRPASCSAWRDATPPGFVFALKGSRFITHNKKLRDVSGALANFFASGPLALGPKLGPIVWQLPERLSFDAERLASFFAMLPRTTREAAELAARHDARLRHGAVLTAGPNRRLRHAIEPRHESFATPAFAALARRHGVAVVVADSAEWPCIEVVTTDFMYVRLHGGERTYASAYGAPALAEWAARVRRWTAGVPGPSALRIDGRRRAAVRDVYVYFDNDLHAHAPRDALALRALLA